jgi:hypothetical protein
MSDVDTLLIRDSTLELQAGRRFRVVRPVSQLAPMLLDYAVLSARAYPEEQLKEEDRKYAAAARDPRLERSS